MAKRRKRYPQKLNISTRPEAVNTRQEFGHWECDLMMFERGKKANIITLVERLTRYSIGIRNENKQAIPTMLAIIKRLNGFKSIIKSITFDQGSEFVKYQWLAECIDTNIYFCDAASPHQKGSIENRNGVIRTLFPRDFDILSVSQRSLDKVISGINERPMKCLNYQAPKDLFIREILNETTWIDTDLI